MDPHENNKIRVLVVDDSALMSRQIAGILSDDDGIDVVGRAKDGQEALDLIHSTKPDVITLDVEMPRMNGITALKHIMVKHAIPTVMISALTTEGARTTFDALKFGAIDVIAKPSRREDDSLDAQKADIVAKVRRAAAIRTGRSRYIRMNRAGGPTIKVSGGAADADTKLVAIGAGTGGYYGLLRVVPSLGPDFRDVLIAVLLVGNKYVAPFISYLDWHSAVPVRSVKGVAIPEKGTCYVCSGQDGLIVEKDEAGKPVFKVGEGSNGGEAPLDRLFESLSAFGQQSVAVVMTGPGSDGAEGSATVRKHGGLCVVQDINNCLDPHMPLAALEIDAADRIVCDYQLGDFLMSVGE